MPILPAEELGRVSVEVLRAAKSPEAEAQTVAQHLVSSNLSGHDSHGVMRVPQYVEDIRQGRVHPGAELSVIRDWPTGSTIDAQGAFGQVACSIAMHRALEKAEEYGLGAVTMRGSGHTGRLGTYGELAASKNMIGMVFNNAGGGGQRVAPFGGRQGRLAPNPLCLASPSGRDFPIVLDISTCVAPEGKVRHAFQAGVKIPDGWLVDPEGRPTNDPAVLYETPRGSLQPIGGIMGHKGFGLAFLVDILGGALSGAGCSRPDGEAPPEDRGLLFAAIDVTRFIPLEAFLAHVSQLFDYIRATPPAPGFDSVMVPGEFEYRQRQERGRDGIDVPEKTWSAIQSLLP